MNRFVKAFAVASFVASPAFAEDPVPVVAASKAYVDSGLVQKASAVALAALELSLVTNDTIAKANAAIPASQKAANNGVATLDGTGKIPSSQLPAQAQADWAQTTSSAVDFIKNKPTLGLVATSNSYDDLDDLPQIPDAQVQADWAQANSSAVDFIKNKPSNLADQSWVLSQIVAAGIGGGSGGDATAVATALLLHTQDTNNPHSVTKAQIGLGNVQNVDQTNASNITSGTVGYARLPVGNTVNTVAAGNDPRFADIANKVDTSALGTMAYEAVEDYATAAQGLLADSATQAFSNSGSGNVVTSVTKNPSTNNVTVTFGTVPTVGEVAALSGRIDNIESLGHYLGSSADMASLPTTVSGAQSFWGISRTPAVGDHVDILADETRGGENNSYRIIDITGNTITWSSTPFRVYSSDTTGFMNRVPGATSGNLATFNGGGQLTDSGVAISGLPTAQQTSNLVSHLSDINNPHSVTKAQVGLGNVANVDQQNASNLTSGTVAVARLPVGTSSGTVAAGNDDRFDTIPTTAPLGQLPQGRAFIWIE